MKTFKQFLSEIWGETEDSVFSSNGKRYDLNALLNATVGMQEVMISVNRLKWILKWDIMSYKDAKRIKQADLSAPLLITKNGSQIVVVDGVHRLSLAVRQRVKELPCIWVSSELMDRYQL